VLGGYLESVMTDAFKDFGANGRGGEQLLCLWGKIAVPAQFYDLE